MAEINEAFCTRCAKTVQLKPDGCCPCCGCEKFDSSQSKVDHPPHYNVGKIEVIDAIEDWQLGFHEGNVVKYVARAPHKGSQLEDLKKARWYLDRRIQQMETADGIQKHS